MAALQNKIPTCKLNDGTEIPVIGYGFGTAWFKKQGDTTINSDLVESAKNAVKLGYQHLDGAEVYRTEEELGQAIQECGIPRDQLFITTKVNTNIADIPAAIDASLKKLRLDYVDLYLIHQPFFAKTEAQLQEAWAAMEQVKASGKARSIGVSNFLQSHLETVLKTAQVIPSLNQIEYHPYLQHGDLVPWQHSKGIKTVSYGGLTPIIRAPDGPLGPLLEALATKYAVSPAEILLRWTVDRGGVAITTSSKEERLAGYLRALSFELTPLEVNEISELGLQKHYRAFWQEKYAADDRS
ncbi:hypothetical protein N7462_002742 [Penicillium macrosclerotiorum]|uniref:uncharacterized protein n=1 Tax=Penicillium macrosclerotiorum TaxID=303699 RepID=UPI002547FC07|nr:uncharacterized protein N7462_002742 [Penicillium macrosclerotiorum]KAJ5693319.1 hypothetical protein N7462_002742 [Penicillium macrosclerotiorum]